MSSNRCTRCGRQLILLDAPKPSLPLQIVTSIREADLARDDLIVIAKAIREAPPDISPRALAAEVPAASKIISVASRAGKNWLALLGVALAVVAIYVAHSDAQQAHRDADQALREAQKAQKTGGLSDEDVRKIATEVETRLKSEGAE